MKLMKKLTKITHKNRAARIAFLLLGLFIGITTTVAQDLHCTVIDAQTQDTIAYANATYRSLKIATSADQKGQFTIARHDGELLEITSVGYKPRKIKITEKTPNELLITLIATSKQLDGVVVKAKRRHRYSRKDNPAVELMRRVIAAKQKTDLTNHDFYQYDKYQKVTMALNNITQAQLETGMFKNLPWLKEQVEMCPYNNKLILPISVDETVTQHIYRKSPKDEKDIIKGQSTKGISQLIQTGEAMNTIIKDLFKDIDLYDDQIELLQARFPSPIGSTAISFYHFYIDDTVKVGDDECIRLQFMPANQQDFGFRGELYVLNDGSLHVRKCDMQLPAGTGVNFVAAMKFKQEYSKLPNGQWALTTDDMMAELEIVSMLQQMLIIRTTGLQNYSFEPIEPSLFKGKAKKKYDSHAKMRDDSFWEEHRTTALSKSEHGMGDFIKRMGRTKGFKTVMFVFKTFMENFVETGSENTPSKVDIGPVNTLISKNYTDGIRLRASARTTANLSPHWFAEGYYAYGTKSKSHYYGSKITYSFNKPEYQPTEFPIRTLSFESYRDLESPSDKYLVHNKDNIFMTFRPVKVEKLYLFNRQRLGFQWETDYGLSTQMKLNTESYINSKQRRMEVNLDAPQFTLTHTIGLKNMLGSQFTYNLTEFSAYKRLWLGSWGNFDMRLMAGAQWNKVPYHLLIMPPVNTSLFEHQGSFNLMENMEFLNDRFAQFNLAWNLEGKIFNRIPLVKKLKWREYVAFKGMWGHLTDKNNPLLPQNVADTELYKFPEGTNVMTNTPYLELVLGIHNIFRMLEIDYVRRLTYTNLSGISKHGIRLGFNVVF